MNEPSRGIILAQRRDRLGARLLTILNCIRIAQDYDTRYRVNWFPKGADAPELDHPETLFDPDWMKRVFIDRSAFDIVSRKARPVRAFANDKTPARLEKHLSAGRAIIVDEGFGILTFPWEDTALIQSRYRDFLGTIGFQPALRTLMADIDQTLSGKCAAAYHIRRGDILDVLPWKHATWTGKIEPEEYYHAHLETQPDQTAIVLSDQPETVARLKRAFPKLLTMDDIVDLSGLDRAARDFLELYAMSRADRVIAPRVSAFSIAAARLAGQERATFGQVLSPQQIATADDRLRRRLKSGPKTFLNASEAAQIYARAHQSLCSQSRTDPDADQDAYDIAAQIIDAGADNAFMPILQALNCLYLGRFKEGSAIAGAALGSHDIWPDEWASFMAFAAALASGQDNRQAAGLFLSGAFWAKPMRPDVTIVATRLLRRNALALELFPPVDWDLLRTLVRPYFPPFQNMFLVPWKLLRRRPSNFDMVLLDWHALTTDQRARRISDDKARLNMLAAWQDQIKKPQTDAPSRRSLQAFLEFRLGGSGVKARADMVSVIKDSPTSALYHKRLADIAADIGDQTAARDAMLAAMACKPECPFVMHALGQLMIRQGDTTQGEAHILAAAETSHGSDVAIKGDAGQIALKNGDYDLAVRYLSQAHTLHPTHPRFINQHKRAAAKQKGE